jgi:UPF0755 protein
MKRRIIIAALAAFVLLVFTLAAYKFIKDNSVARNSQGMHYIISSDKTLENVAEDLKYRGVIKYKRYFLHLAKKNKLQGEIKSVKVVIEPGSSIKQLIEKLKNQKSDFEVVTIPEGFSLYQIAERLEKLNLVNKESFMKLGLKDVNDVLITEQRKDVLFELEGFLFPSTYYIPMGSSEKDIALIMYKRFSSVFSEEYISRAKQLGLSINNIITVAALVEKEAANNEERSRIAGVIYNRIKKGMPLQIDAAVIYANTKGQGHLQRVLNSNLKFDSPYNTYIYKGLTPGPITSPGKPSIEAALYPEDNEFLYYVAGEKGHVFSKSYEEHLKNVKAYREALSKK